MYKCWWCHKDKKPYAFNLCLSCYRWFLRAAQNPPIRCTICECVISKKHEKEMMCVSCRQAVQKSIYKAKRIEHMENKYAPITQFLTKIKDNGLDPELQLTSIFKFKNRKLAEIICERFYNKKTLQEVGTNYNVSREYIRQCEDKAVNLLKNYINGEIP
jgi:DNA-directed RNA polymerase specialized sigma subunit